LVLLDGGLVAQVFNLCSILTLPRNSQAESLCHSYPE
jgi:hypothetical protein